MAEPQVPPLDVTWAPEWWEQMELPFPDVRVKVRRGKERDERTQKRSQVGG